MLRNHHNALLNSGNNVTYNRKIRCCKNCCRQLSSTVAAARPQPLMLGRTRESQSHKRLHRKLSGSHATVPLTTRGAEQRRPETQRTTAQRLSANMAVKEVTPQLTSNNLTEPQTDVARRSHRVQSFIKVPDLIPFQPQPHI